MCRSTRFVSAIARVSIPVSFDLFFKWLLSNDSPTLKKLKVCSGRARGYLFLPIICSSGTKKLLDLPSTCAHSRRSKWALRPLFLCSASSTWADLIRRWPNLQTQVDLQSLWSSTVPVGSRLPFHEISGKVLQAYPLETCGTDVGLSSATSGRVCALPFSADLDLR